MKHFSEFFDIILKREIRKNNGEFLKVKITLNEQMLLLIIWKLGDEAYGYTIREKINAYTQKEIAFGTLYNNLDQLIRKGYAVSHKGEPTAIRGGKRKVYYKITAKGRDALQAARELQAKLWKGIPEYAFMKGK